MTDTAPEATKQRLLNSLSRLARARKPNSTTTPATTLPVPTTPSPATATVAATQLPLKRPTPPVDDTPFTPAPAKRLAAPVASPTGTVPLRAPESLLPTARGKPNPLVPQRTPAPALKPSESTATPAKSRTPTTLVPPSAFLSRLIRSASHSDRSERKLPGPAGFVRLDATPLRDHTTTGRSGSPWTGTRNKPQETLHQPSECRSPAPQPNSSSAHQSLLEEHSALDNFQLYDIKDDTFDKPTWSHVITALNIPQYKPSTLEELYPNDAVYLQYNIYTILQTRPAEKIPFLLVMIRETRWSYMDAFVTVIDPTGEIQGTIHRKVMDEHANEISVGTALVLRDITLFQPNERCQYLNITQRNIAFMAFLEAKTTYDLDTGESLVEQELRTWQAPDFNLGGLASRHTPVTVPTSALLPRQLFPSAHRASIPSPRGANDGEHAADWEPDINDSGVHTTQAKAAVDSAVLDDPDLEQFLASDKLSLSPISATEPPKAIPASTTVAQLPITEGDDMDDDLLFLMDSIE
ncbi:hypothetical protein IWQ62_002691 [Dispira parvispora]|uniref:Homologous recombination OB-fold protein OB-fold domain-containing protein n=1 Tax=Dispira parvispora TaxID=1520584 RepID=A0A9W8AT97_9FUNG|nr:hypothetical protein IWQ62_002691 [Dispira parvispora]